MGRRVLRLDVFRGLLADHFQYGGHIAGAVRINAETPTLDSDKARTQASSDAAYGGRRICHYPRIHIRNFAMGYREECHSERVLFSQTSLKF